jgi:hypothetical protein
LIVAPGWLEIQLDTMPVREQRIAVSLAPFADGGDLRWRELAVDDIAYADRDTRHLDAS